MGLKDIRKVVGDVRDIEDLKMRGGEGWVKVGGMGDMVEGVGA